MLLEMRQLELEAIGAAGRIVSSFGSGLCLMLCAQLGWKEEFDCIWKWFKTYEALFQKAKRKSICPIGAKWAGWSGKRLPEALR
ncbi:MAG: hypothetical protein NC389_07995 [Acetatifactor muris]|nr:hypothetical protein [Acetatifactor muris]